MDSSLKNEYLIIFLYKYINKMKSIYMKTSLFKCKNLVKNINNKKIEVLNENI